MRIYQTNDCQLPLMAASTERKAEKQEIDESQILAEFGDREGELDPEQFSSDRSYFSKCRRCGADVRIRGKRSACPNCY